eukprot:7907579-Pyramimonas_sp.AAC.1
MVGHHIAILLPSFSSVCCAVYVMLGIPHGDIARPPWDAGSDANALLATRSRAILSAQFFLE